MSPEQWLQLQSLVANYGPEQLIFEHENGSQFEFENVSYLDAEGYVVVLLSN